jgi:hypothetical protein
MLLPPLDDLICPLTDAAIVPSNQPPAEAKRFLNKGHLVKHFELGLSQPHPPERRDDLPFQSTGHARGSSCRSRETDAA